MADPSLLWLRRDLRLDDHAALVAAVGEGPVIPVYVLDDETPRHRRMGEASRWWLHHSLARVDAALRARGSRLILRRGRSDIVLTELARESGAKRVHTMRHGEPWWRNAERAVAARLELCRHDGNYLASFGSIRSGAGTPYRIFTPFWRTLSDCLAPAMPLSCPARIAGPETWPRSDRLETWNLLPVAPDWATGFAAAWEPGEETARQLLGRFADHVGEYGEWRDFPAQDAVSRLSPHLHFGEISPARVRKYLEEAGEAAGPFLRQLGWRDYAQNLVLQLPDYGAQPGNAAFADFPWREGEAADADFRAWTRGHTGYPIVDAGMRALWATGWMHNRVRMIVASFLVKHLLIDWRRGEQWFWDTLVDADYANNSVNWQWVAGTGVDPNPFGRIMAPIVQSEKFAAEAYIRRWVPELAHLKDRAIHDPDTAGCRPADYPPKIIGHKEGRNRALETFAAWRAEHR